jgi:hypothetical protein
MVAGLQRDVQSVPTRYPSGFVQGDYLGVVTSGPRMPALAYHGSVARDDGPNERVRRNRVTPALSETAGKIHHRILQHIFLSPIRTLTVGAGLRLAVNTNLHRLNLQRGSRAPRQGRKTTLSGSPPVREFHPPPKVTQQAIPQKDHGSKEIPRNSTFSYAPGAARISCGQGCDSGGNPMTRYYALVLVPEAVPEDEACDAAAIVTPGSGWHEVEPGQMWDDDAWVAKGCDILLRAAGYLALRYVLHF